MNAHKKEIKTIRDAVKTVYLKNSRYAWEESPTNRTKYLFNDIIQEISSELKKMNEPAKQSKTNKKEHSVFQENLILKSQHRDTSYSIKSLNFNVERNFHTFKQKSQYHTWWEIQSRFWLFCSDIQSQRKGTHVSVYGGKKVSRDYVTPS